MLNLLKKFRSNLFTKSRARKYLLYAFGEIVLVVVGILIALQINNWNEDRLERKVEYEYITSMLADLREDSRRIDDATEGNVILLNGLDSMLGLLSEMSDDEAQLRELFKHSVVHTYWYLRVDFSESTMSQLKSSGGLRLINDKVVREAMLTYDKGLEDCKHQYEEIVHYFHVNEETQKQIFDLSLGKDAYVLLEQDYLKMLEPLTAFDPLISNGQYLIDKEPKLRRRYYNDILFYRTTLNNINVFLLVQKELATTLIQLIQERYEIN